MSPEEAGVFIDTQPAGEIQGTAGDGTTPGVGNLRILRAIPGGAAALPEEAYAAAVLFGALGLLWAMRRNLGQENGHVHIGGTAAIVFLLFYLIATGVIRVLASNLAARGDSSLARGVAFFA